jgi:hypothetical protein
MELSGATEKKSPVTPSGTFFNVQAIQLILNQYNQCPSHPVNSELINQSSISPINVQAVKSNIKQSTLCSNNPVYLKAVQSMLKQFNQCSSSSIEDLADQFMLK